VRAVPLFVVLLAFGAQAEVPVVDVGSGVNVTPVQAGAGSSDTSKAFAVDDSASSAGGQDSSQLFFQLQTLQQEVQALRGLVEEQANMIRKLKQQRLDDYVDLDRRIAELSQSGIAAGNSGGPASGGGTSVSPVSGQSPVPGSGGSGNGADEKARYTAAYALLKERKVDDAIVAFKKHIQDYPQGKYAANAHYWLGEIYLLQGELSNAENEFSTLIKTYPENRKRPDAEFKLGKVYFQQSKKPEAKKLISEVAAGSSSVAPLAKTYLENNF